jgi:hypothetical protein
MLVTSVKTVKVKLMQLINNKILKLSIYLDVRKSCLTFPDCISFMQEDHQGTAKLICAEMLPCSIFLHLFIITSLV